MFKPTGQRKKCSPSQVLPADQIIRSLDNENRSGVSFLLPGAEGPSKGVSWLSAPCLVLLFPKLFHYSSSSSPRVLVSFSVINGNDCQQMQAENFPWEISWDFQEVKWSFFKQMNKKQQHRFSKSRITSPILFPSFETMIFQWFNEDAMAHRLTTWKCLNSTKSSQPFMSWKPFLCLYSDFYWQQCTFYNDCFPASFITLSLVPNCLGVS